MGLRVEDIYSGYGRMEILHGVSILVEKSKIVIVIGPNGAGKTVLLHTIMGLIKVRKGKIFCDDVEITNIRANNLIKMGLSFVPQSKQIFSKMTVIENLEMGCFLEKDRIKKEESFKKIFELFPILEERQNQKAGTLSGGEQKMLSIGRALMLNPKVLLLDEPSLGLAPKFVSLIFQNTVTLREELDLAILIVEQNVRKALEIADYGYLIELGRCKFEGTQSELRKNYEVTKSTSGWMKKLQEELK
jgi:branched-chain amino acid transport system ATP-binding protein